jgi:hypothetical protein
MITQDRRSAAVDANTKNALAAYLENVIRVLDAPDVGADQDICIAREGLDQLRWVTAALRGRLRRPGGHSMAGMVLESFARRVDEWVHDSRRVGARVRSRGGAWEDVTSVPIGMALALLAERSEAGCENAALLEERLAGIVYLLSRDGGEPDFHACTKKSVEDVSAVGLSKDLRRIAASVTLASAIEG